MTAVSCTVHRLNRRLILTSLFAVFTATGCHGVDGMRLLLNGGGFHFRDPINAQFGRDLEDIDHMADPEQRAEALVQVKDKMLAAGYGPDDTRPVLRGRVDQVLFDLRRQGKDAFAFEVEGAFGRVPPTQRFEHRLEIISH